MVLWRVWWFFRWFYGGFGDFIKDFMGRAVDGFLRDFTRFLESISS